jgi:hypothetical protein
MRQNQECCRFNESVKTFKQNIYNGVYFQFGILLLSEVIDTFNVAMIQSCTVVYHKI